MVGRKLADNGDEAYRILDEIEACSEVARLQFPEMAADVWSAAESMREATEWLVSQSDMNDRFSGSVAYLRAFARILGGCFHLKSAVVEGGAGARTRLAKFYIKRLMPEYAARLAEVREGSADLYAITPEDLAG